MPTFAPNVIDAVSKSVTPSAFTMDQFEPLKADLVRVTVINTDVSQTCNAYLETRAKVGAGTWCRHSTTSFDAIGPGEGRSETVDVSGAGEVRVMATASGAGLTATYSRRNLYRSIDR